MTDKEAMQYLYIGIAQGIVRISDTNEHSCNYDRHCGQCPCQPFCRHVENTRLDTWEQSSTDILMNNYSLANYHKFRQDYPELLI